MDQLVRFHLAFPCHDVPETVEFYRALGATVGRRNDRAAILNLFGHQIVAHRVPTIEPQPGIYPRHFGAMISPVQLHELEVALMELAPERTQRRLRFKGEFLEHDSLQSRDPSGNVLEFKHYTNDAAVFSPSKDGDLRIGDVPL